jgi:hypothetical protein
MSRTLLAAARPNAARDYEAEILAYSPFRWWDYDASRVTLSGSDITQIADIVGGNVITFDVGHRPTHDTSNPAQPVGVFGAAAASLGVSAGASPLSGWTEGTAILVLKDYGTSPGASGIWAYAGAALGTAVSGRWNMLTTNTANGHPRCLVEKTAGTLNRVDVSAAIDTAAHHVWCSRFKFSDGTTATKKPRMDGTEQTSTYLDAGNVSGGSLGAYYIRIGAFGDNSLYVKGEMSDFMLFDSELSATDADAVAALLLSYRGLT